MDLNHILNVVTGLIGCVVILVGGPYNKFLGAIGCIYFGAHSMVADNIPIYKPLIIICLLFLGIDPLSKSNNSMVVRLFISLIASIAIVYVGWGYPPGPLVPSPFINGPEETVGETLPVSEFHLTVGDYRIWTIDEQDGDEYIIVGATGERTYSGKQLYAVKIPNIELPEDFFNNYKGYRLEVSAKGSWEFKRCP